MSMQFSVVSRGTTILAEHAMVPGNFYQVVHHVLPLIADSTESRKSYSRSNVMFHSLKEGKLIYLVIADKDFDQARAFKYLSVIQKKFLTRYSAYANVAYAYAMSMEFSKVMSVKMKLYNSAEPYEITSMQEQVEEIKKIMVRNVEEVVNRGELLRLLADRTKVLSNDARAFNRSSKSGRWDMLRKHIKWIITLLLALLLVTCIIVSACGGLALPRCVSSKSANQNLTGLY